MNVLCSDSECSWMQTKIIKLFISAVKIFNTKI